MNQIPDEELILILKDVSSLAYHQQYTRWNLFLAELQKNNSTNYISYLEIFLQLFPFTLTHWKKLISLKPDDVSNSYLKALIKNPRCFQLWRQYIEHVKSSQDVSKYKKELQRAIIQVGADLNSYHFFTQYYELISDNNTKYQFFKKLFTRPIRNLQKLLAIFDNWLDHLPSNQLQSIYYKQTKDNTQDVNHTQYLRTYIHKIFKETLQYRKQRENIQAQIKHFYFSDHPDRPKQLQLWRKYIYLERSYGVVENIYYCYERALLSHTQLVDLWEEVFHYLQNQTGKYLSVFTILRNHSQFFINFNTKLYYYWCDLEERENPETARRMYIKLQGHKPIGETNIEVQIQVYLRHIQMQLRQNNLNNAKELYDHLLLVNQSNYQILCYIVVEYANFIKTKYKQMQFSKKLFKSYFQALQFNNYLFMNFLQFMRYFENHEGYYDELMSILTQGYSKAKQIGQSQANHTMTFIKHHLRSSLGSMNLIKISQKRLHELESSISA